MYPDVELLCSQYLSYNFLKNLVFWMFILYFTQKLVNVFTKDHQLRRIFFLRFSYRSCAL